MENYFNILPEDLIIIIIKYIDLNRKQKFNDEILSFRLLSSYISNCINKYVDNINKGLINNFIKYNFSDINYILKNILKSKIYDKYIGYIIYKILEVFYNIQSKKVKIIVEKIIVDIN